MDTKDTAPTMKEVMSPCRSKCLLNDANICQGCYRTAHEISDWVTLSNEEKWGVIKQAKRRERDEGNN